MKELSYLNKYLFKYKYRLLLGVLFIIISKVFSTLPAQIVREVIDYLTASFGQYEDLHGPARGYFREDFEYQIMMKGLMILFLSILSGVFLYLQRQTIIGASRYIEYDLKNEIYAHYQELPLSFYRKNNTGDLMARISEDVNHVRMYLGPAIMYGLDLLVLFCITIPIMLSVSVKLTIYVLLPLPILALSIYLIHNKMNRRSEAIQRGLSELSTFVQEAFSGIRVIKAFVREKDSAERFTTESNNYKDKSLSLTSVNAFFFPLIVTLTGLSAIFIVWIGGKQVMAGEISYGNIAEFFIYLNRLTWPVAALGWTTSLVQRAEASQQRINEFLKTKNSIVSLKNIEKEIKGDIEFTDVSFIYPDSGIQALSNVSFKIKEGESVAIVGSTGSGKSTIANLLCRMYDVTAGFIKVDGVDIRDYKLNNLRSQIGYVPQDVFLFSDTIRNNLTFGSLNLPEENLLQASKDADLHDNIRNFPKGYDTILGERGITLSGGQKQRLSIARAIARKPKLLILDDCLSAVDTNTENNILNSLQRVMKDRTSIIISHRVSSVKLANHILVLEAGQIVERGTHDSLMASGGLYASLYQKQLTEQKAPAKL